MTLEERLHCLGVAAVVITIPEWGGDILVRGLTETERRDHLLTCHALKAEVDQLRASLPPLAKMSWDDIARVKAATRRIRLEDARLVARSLIDADGRRALGDAAAEKLAEPEHVETLDRIVAELFKLNWVEQGGEQHPDAS